jgi:uncharacterized protein DUF1360
VDKGDSQHVLVDMSVPSWWEALLLASGAWRVFHLLAHDEILERPRRYVTRLNKTWTKEGEATGEDYREALGRFIDCPFCFGFWIALAWWVSWLIWPTETLYAATPLMLSAGVVAAQRLLSSE